MVQKNALRFWYKKDIVFLRAQRLVVFGMLRNYYFWHASNQGLLRVLETIWFLWYHKIRLLNNCCFSHPVLIKIFYIFRTPETLFLRVQVAGVYLCHFWYDKFSWFCSIFCNYLEEVFDFQNIISSVLFLVLY